MLRLRATTALSVLALAIGSAGTGWLSTLTASGYAPSPRFVARPMAPAARAVAPPARGARVARSAAVARPAKPEASPHTWRAVAVATELDRVVEMEAAVDLLPLTTPTDQSLPWQQLRGHLDGQLRLAVSVDRNGLVTAASVAQSSGDQLLDAHALRSVRRWHFSVPADHPDGLHGEVPMRFTSATNRNAL